MKKKMISVIMSVFNTKSEYLEESIKSILDQTYSNFEFIIINDASEPRVENILNSIQDPRVLIINNKTNKGLTYNLNKAIELSKGEFIARMDSDDISTSDRLEKQLNFLLKNPDVGVVGSAARTIGNKIRFHVPKGNHEVLKSRLIFNNVMIHPSIMIRKSVLKDNMYDTNFKYAQDYELWSRLIWETKFFNLPNFLLKYRIHDKQITSTKLEEQYFTSNQVRKRMIERIHPSISEQSLALLNKGSNGIPLNNGELKQFAKLSKLIISKNSNRKVYNERNLSEAVQENFERSLFISLREKEEIDFKVLNFKISKRTKFFALSYILFFKNRILRRNNR